MHPEPKPALPAVPGVLRWLQRAQLALSPYNGGDKSVLSLWKPRVGFWDRRVTPDAANEGVEDSPTAGHAAAFPASGRGWLAWRKQLPQDSEARMGECVCPVRGDDGKALEDYATKCTREAESFEGQGLQSRAASSQLSGSSPLKDMDWRHFEAVVWQHLR
ncbi:hypothetical protein Y1Q_0011129 [Alligator mississippiensis]|uniref:Uncharacterized protein n=1 Tax=Alligator mississippiensis TaxID=8496 RepID=A0A151NM98_ALLMI|nr:hypothetical protein Y1Q_0011129 [Alligator mississippiensis]